MKNLSILLSTLVIATLFNCGNESVNEEDDLSLTIRSDSMSWELTEIKLENQEWRSVNDDEKHTLLFKGNSQIEYVNFHGSCNGNYLLEQIDGGTKLILENLPCSVQESHMWYSHIIISNTNSIVITEPRLNPTAVLSVTKYKYIVRSK
jgi:hypothetical protein